MLAPCTAILGARRAGRPPAVHVVQPASDAENRLQGALDADATRLERPRQRRTRADTTGGAAPQIKTTASSTYRVWPNCGPLEPGETQRVQILLLGTKVRSRRPYPPPPTLPEPIRRLPRPLPAHCPARPSMSASESALPLPPGAHPWHDSPSSASVLASCRCAALRAAQHGAMASQLPEGAL